MAHRIRRSQAVVPFGVGAIVDLQDDALMAAGLDAWPDEPAEELSDERLAARLRVTYFRQPPAAPEPGRPGARLPFVRFPYWHFCPRCRALHRLEGVAPVRPSCDSMVVSPVFKKRVEGCGTLPASRRPRLLPLRFVIACKGGHIEDFPWIEWAHSGAGAPLSRGLGCAAPALFFFATSRGGLSGLLVQCAGCGKKRSLLGSTGRGALEGFGCAGARPWLGVSSREQCSALEPPQVLQRGASNVYFPNTASSVLIPPFSKRARAIIDRPAVWALLRSVTEHGRIPDRHVELVAKEKGVPFDEFVAAVRAKETGEGPTATPDDSEERYRFAEYAALQRRNQAGDDQLVTVPTDMKAHSGLIPEMFDAVVMVESLAETRALTGFTRIEPAGGQGVAVAPLSRRPRDWLPAYRVQGEGIFLALKRSFLDAWLARLGDGLARLIQRARAAGARLALEPTAELVALHTLSHLLILRLSFEAGYGTSSIRERIYCAPEDSPTPMCGILLYTAAGDADGTLGGLVRQGDPRRFGALLANALQDARWCSADPVCRESRGQGVASLNLAACHACALLPETSCEFGNRLLDRLSVVGVQGQDARPGLLRTPS